MFQKKLTRRDFLTGTAMAAAGAMVTACAPKAGAVQPTMVPPTDVPLVPTTFAPPTAAASSGLTYQGDLEFWDWTYVARQEYLKKLSTEWTSKNPGININVTAMDWGDAQTKLITAASAKNTPPFANIHSSWRPDLQREGYLAPYPEDLLPFDKMMSTPFLKDPTTGRIYTCTFNYFCDQLYVNTDLLAKDGIKVEDVPTKWDEYFKMCQQLTKRDSTGKITQVGMTLNHYYSREWLWQTLLYQLGGWQFSEDGQQAIWNSKEGVEALKMIKDVYMTYKIDDPEFLGLFDAFGTGVAATYISQGYTGAGINTEHPDMLGKWTTLTTPTFTGGLPDHAWGVVSPEEGVGVFTTATEEQQAACFDFIKYMIGPDDAVIKWASLQLGPCDRIDLLENEAFKQNDLNNIIATQAKTMPYRVNYGERPLEAEKYWRDMFDAVILMDADPQAALDTATAGVNAELVASNKKRIITERGYTQPKA